jgi:hypothetical protein
MKAFLLGALVAFVAIGLVFFSLRLRERWKMELGHDVWVKNLSDRFSEKIEVRDNNTLLFTASFESNGFNIRVPSMHAYPDKLFFSEHQQDGISLYDLNASVTMGDGTEKEIEYDMATGKALKTFVISADRTKIEMFDSKGTLLETKKLK